MKLSLLIGLSLFAAAPAARAETLIVTQIVNTFSPNAASIPIGTTVRWVWTSGAHTVTEGTDGIVNGNEAFHGPLTSSAPIFEVTFDQAFIDAHPPTAGNQYDYFCLPHFGSFMWGTITIEPGPGFIFGHCNGFGGNPQCDNYGPWGEGCPNSTGAGAELRTTGTASVVADDLKLQVSSLPPNQNALLFVGDQWLAGGDGLPFGDGLRCVGGSVIRLSIASANASGFHEWGPGLGATGGWAAGQTRYFQVWYRDPIGSPCGTGYNLSNGIAVAFSN